MSSPNESANGRPAVFLDRDGTIMRDAEYCGDPRQVEVYPGVTHALEQLKAAGFGIYVITNQSGIGRGYFTKEAYQAVEAEVARQVGPGLIDATYFCPDHPDNSSKRRKPGAGMIFEAQQDHGIDLTRSFMVGDKSIDVECGRTAGVRTILVETGNQKSTNATAADWEARTFVEAAEIILRHAI